MAAAIRAGETRAFFWTQMNYRALVGPIRAALDAGLCPCCGHTFLSERDVQLEHCEPPRHRQDWARLHVRNIRIACTSCNLTKGIRPFAVWLDEQEDARRSNLAQPSEAAAVQLSLL